MVTTILEDRWKEAMENPTAEQWHSIAAWACDIADSIEHTYPGHILAAAHRGVYEEAYKRYLAMMPKEIAA